MDKLEQYLDQVCRRMGGPRELRQHLKQELREHLRDAAADHVAAGMSEEEALKKALEDFGGPDQVRAELEAEHGQRLMAVAIDKAMQWKEKTMKAKWIWTTWAHAMLLVIIVLEMLIVLAGQIFIFPKYREYAAMGLLSTTAGGQVGQINAWSFGVLWRTGMICVEWGWWLLLAVALAAALFEWRVRSENKAFMRLAALGTLATGLLVVVGLTSAALILPPIIALGDQGLPQRIIDEHVPKLDESVRLLDAAAARMDWTEILLNAGEAGRHLTRAKDMGVQADVAFSPDVKPQLQRTRERLTGAQEALREAIRAAGASDTTLLNAALRKFHESYDPLHAGATTRPAK